MYRGQAFGLVIVGLIACDRATASRQHAGSLGSATGVQITVSLRGDGTGRVTSIPAGIDCPGSCTMTVPNETLLTLTASPGTDSRFRGWSGQCVGTQSCTITAARDQSVVASFAPIPPDTCDGVVPAALGQSVSRVIYESPGYWTFCEDAVSDAAGNVAGFVGGRGGPFGWTIWAPDGTAEGKIATSDLVPQAVGFQGIAFYPSGNDVAAAFYSWTPTGTVLRRTDVARDPKSTSTVASAFAAVTGGSVAVSTTCYANGPGRATSELIVSRFDRDGVLISTASVGGEGCFSAGAVADEFDNTLVVLMDDGGGALGFPEDRVVARWLARDGQPLTNWFDAGPSPAGDPEVRPLIGGGAVVGNGFVWLAAFRSGVPVADERPSFLIDDDKLHIVRSGRGYAQFSVNDVSRYGTLKLYSPAARFCGDLRVEEGSELHIGKDGTVMALSGPQRCSIRWWPRLLK